MAQGGKFEHGFLSGFVSSLGGSFLQANGGNMSGAERIAISAAIGGTAEAMGGGKFANGAVTGAYVMALNHMGEHGFSEDFERRYAKKLVERYQKNEVKIMAGSLVAEALLEATEPGKLLSKFRELYTETYGTEISKENMEVYSHGIKAIRALNKSLGTEAFSNVALVKTSAAILSEVVYLQIENGFIANTIKYLDKPTYEQFIITDLRNGMGGGGAKGSPW
jgi:hypothetical protein